MRQTQIGWIALVIAAQAAGGSKLVLGQAASHTSRLMLFPAVTNPFTRDASVLASAIQTVEELAPGRVEVAAIDPVASMTAIDNPALIEKARVVRGKLEKVIQSL